MYCQRVESQFMQDLSAELECEVSSLAKVLAKSQFVPDPRLGLSRLRILRQIKESGPCTVPDLARQLNTSRQNIQTITNHLLSLRFVEAAANSAHKRSPLFNLTASGLAVLSSTRFPTDPRLSKIIEDSDKSAINAAIQTLRKLRTALLNEREPTQAAAINLQSKKDDQVEPEPENETALPYNLL